MPTHTPTTTPTTIFLAACGLMCSASAALAQGTPPIYVSQALGDDANPGTPSQPVATLDAARALAVGTMRVMYLDQGLYVSVGLDDGDVLLGDFDAAGGWGRDPAAFTSELICGTVFNARGIVLDGLRIRPFSSQPSRHGLSLYGCEDVFISNCSFFADAGLDGRDGVDGLNGGTGLNGQRGRPGVESDTTIFCARGGRPVGGVPGAGPGFPGGAGGDAGLGDDSGDEGRTGTGPAGGGGGRAIPPERGNWCPAADYLGAIGGSGTHGVDGAQGVEGPLILGTYRLELPRPGTDGLPGSGGGGGGGGGGAPPVAIVTAAAGPGAVPGVAAGGRGEKPSAAARRSRWWSRRPRASLSRPRPSPPRAGATGASAAGAARAATADWAAWPCARRATSTAEPASRTRAPTADAAATGDAAATAATAARARAGPASACGSSRATRST